MAMTAAKSSTSSPHVRMVFLIGDSSDECDMTRSGSRDPGTPALLTSPAKS